MFRTSLHCCRGVLQEPLASSNPRIVWSQNHNDFQVNGQNCLFLVCEYQCWACCGLAVSVRLKHRPTLVHTERAGRGETEKADRCHPRKRKLLFGLAPPAFFGKWKGVDHDVGFYGQRFFPESSYSILTLDFDFMICFTCSNVALVWANGCSSVTLGASASSNPTRELSPRLVMENWFLPCRGRFVA